MAQKLQTNKKIICYSFQYIYQPIYNDAIFTQYKYHSHSNDLLICQPHLLEYNILHKKLTHYLRLYFIYSFSCKIQGLLQSLENKTT